MNSKKNPKQVVWEIKILHHDGGYEDRLGSRGPLVVAIDVELLARGKSEDTPRLTGGLANRKQTTIIYTGETRSVDGIRLSERLLQLPPADVVIGDAGASVSSRTDNPGIAELDRFLASKWESTQHQRCCVYWMPLMLTLHRPLWPVLSWKKSVLRRAAVGELSLAKPSPE